MMVKKMTFTLDDKIKLAEDEIKKHYDLNNGNIFISFSGGKDSTVLRHIALKLYPDIKVVFSDTTNELLEIYKYVKSFDNIIWVNPVMNFKNVIEKYGFPLVSKEVSQKVNDLKHSQGKRLKNTRLKGDIKGNGKLSNKWQFLAEQTFDVTHKCCKILKKDPLDKWAKANNMMPIIGLISDESRLREQLALYGSDNGKVYPFLRNGWIEKDIWDYAKKYNIRFAECYYDRYVDDFLIKARTRTGCEYCGFGIHLEKDSRFLRSSLLAPKRYKKMMSLKNNGITFLDAINIVMQKDLPLPLLGLYGYKIMNVEERDSDIYFELKHLHDKKKCKHCNSSSIRKKGIRSQIYVDVPIRDKNVTLNVKVQCYVCKECLKFFQAYLPFMSNFHSMTDRLVDYIKVKSFENSFTKIASDLDLSEGTIRYVLKKNKVTYFTILKEV